MEIKREKLPILSRLTVISVIISTMLSGCQTVNNAGDSVGRTTLGCVGGTILGAGIGALLNGKNGAVKGAAIGLAAGCAAGYAWDQHEKELQRLAQEENLRLKIEHIYVDQSSTTNQSTSNKNQVVGLVTQVGDETMFDTGNAEPTAAGLEKLKKLAVVYFQSRESSHRQQTPILVVGHTDDTGSAEYNQQLSESRAKKVVEILSAQGIPADQLYFQGAGQGRPIADNSTEDGRATNRRVEVVELPDDATLVKHITAENLNPRYIQHAVHDELKNKEKASNSTTKEIATNHKQSKKTQTRNVKNVAPAATPNSAADAATSEPSTTSESSAVNKQGSQIDFGGKPASSGWELASAFKPDYSGGFGLFNSAVASDTVFSSCSQDAPRVIGNVKNLAGKTISTHQTSDYLSGMNGKVWATKVNGHVVYINPVAVLRENGRLAKQPQIAITENYDKGERQITGKYQAVAETYKGKDNLLMRIFIEDANAPMQCLDVLLPYGGTQAQQGELYYQKANHGYVADYAPRNTSL